jgi:hypothetical protein
MDGAVHLDPDHPGFRDAVYRTRRNEIAALARAHAGGEVAPVEYTAEEHATWRAIWAGLAPLHERYACAAFREGARRVRLDRERVPQFAHLNPLLREVTGFTLRPVAGLVDDRTFLAALAGNAFLATQDMRHPSRPFYTPEPDVAHELIGHATTFAEATYARLNRAFGRAARDTLRPDRLPAHALRGRRIRGPGRRGGGVARLGVMRTALCVELPPSCTAAPARRSRRAAYCAAYSRNSSSTRPSTSPIVFSSGSSVIRKWSA